MSRLDSVKVIRAWKDEAYRLGLSEAERALLPDHPAGHLEPAEGDLERVAGGGRPPSPIEPTTTVISLACWFDHLTICYHRPST